MSLRKKISNLRQRIEPTVSHVTKLTLWVLTNPSRTVALIENAIMESEVQKIIREINQEEIRKRQDN